MTVKGAHTSASLGVIFLEAKLMNAMVAVVGAEGGSLKHSGGERLEMEA